MKTYTLYDVISLPANFEKGISTRRQTVLSIIEGDESEHTTIEPSKNDVEGFEHHIVRHEDRRLVAGRWQGKKLDYVIEEQKFSIFIKKTENLLIATQKKIWKKAHQRLESDSGDFQLRGRGVDLSKIVAQVPQVTGGYFSDLDLADVDAASVFGSRVSESTEWERYEDVGTVSAIIVNVPFRNVGKIMLTSDGTVCLYHPSTEEEDLQTVLHVDEFIRTLGAQMPLPTKKYGEALESLKRGLESIDES